MSDDIPTQKLTHNNNKRSCCYQRLEISLREEDGTTVCGEFKVIEVITFNTRKHLCLATVNADQQPIIFHFKHTTYNNQHRLLESVFGLLLKWTPLSRPFFARNKLISGGV